MISRPNHRRIAGSLALCYVLASTLSGLWHSHGGEHRGAVHPHTDHDCGASEGGASEGGDHHGCPPGDDDCVVCRFAAQSALPIFSAPELGRGELVVEVRRASPAAPSLAIVSCSLARAPPAGQS